MVFRFLLAAFLAVFSAISAPAVLAQQVGTASAVVQGAEIRSAAGRARLVAGTALAMGDVVTTDAQGQAQLLFADGTRMVVGPGSRLVIDQILMQGNGTAQTFAVSAVGGTFRFITGKSAKPAYKILTPTATLGLRGTEFDFAVSPRRGTNVVLFRGRVLLCAQGGELCRGARPLHAGGRHDPGARRRGRNTGRKSGHHRRGVSLRRRSIRPCAGLSGKHRPVQRRGPQRVGGAQGQGRSGSRAGAHPEPQRSGNPEPA